MARDRRNRKSDEISVVTSEVSEIQMLLEKYYNAYGDRIGLEKCLPRQQNKCRERHVQAAINALQLSQFVFVMTESAYLAKSTRFHLEIHI